MKVQLLDHVALHVEDVLRSTEFYANILQLRQIPRPAFTFPGAWFELGSGQTLHLIGERTQPVISGNRGNHFAMLVDDIHAWDRHLTPEICTRVPLKIRPDGAYQIFLTDPDGHVVELCSLPGTAPQGTSIGY